jgi:hypothetical protein
MGDGDWGRRFSWEMGRVKKKGVSAARVMALYGRGAGVRKKVKGEGSLELVAEQRDFEEEEKSSRGRIGDYEREKIYSIAAGNLKRRKAGGFKSISWKKVLKEVYSELSYLKSVSPERIKEAYRHQKPRAKNVGGGRKSNLFDSEITEGLFEVARKYTYLEGDSDRIIPGGWPKIYEEMQERFPVLKGVNESSIRNLYHREKHRRKR